MHSSEQALQQGQHPPPFNCTATPFYLSPQYGHILPGRKIPLQTPDFFIPLVENARPCTTQFTPSTWLRPAFSISRCPWYFLLPPLGYVQVLSLWSPVFKSLSRILSRQCTFQVFPSRRMGHFLTLFPIPTFYIFRMLPSISSEKYFPFPPLNMQLAIIVGYVGIS